MSVDPESAKDESAGDVVAVDNIGEMQNRKREQHSFLLTEQQQNFLINKNANAHFFAQGMVPNINLLPFQANATYQQHLVQLQQQQRFGPLCSVNGTCLPTIDSQCTKREGKAVSKSQALHWGKLMEALAIPKRKRRPKRKGLKGSQKTFICKLKECTKVRELKKKMCSLSQLDKGNHN